jgi:hypothetical protein
MAHMDRRAIADGFGQLVGQQGLGERDPQGVEELRARRL